MKTISEAVADLLLLITATHAAASELELPRYSARNPAAIGGADLARCLSDLRNAADSARGVLRALELNWHPQRGVNEQALALGGGEKLTPQPEASSSNKP